MPYPNKEVCSRCDGPRDPRSEMCRACSLQYRRGERAPNWKGGRSVDPAGYVFVSGHQGHPNANRTGVIREHILVMSEHLGRPLLEGETVHHINGDRSDNRIENLQLRIGNHGPGQAYVCIDCGSERIKPVPLKE